MRRLWGAFVHLEMTGDSLQPHKIKTRTYETLPVVISCTCKWSTYTQTNRTEGWTTSTTTSCQKNFAEKKHCKKPVSKGNILETDDTNHRQLFSITKLNTNFCAPVQITVPSNGRPSQLSCLRLDIGVTRAHLWAQQAEHLKNVVLNDYVSWILFYFSNCGAVGWSTAIQVGRSRVRFPMVLLEFFIDIILLASL